MVATSLIEAGVDMDFPEVWRALAGLDSVAQAAGRCNREGKLALARTVVFEPVEVEPPRDLRPLIACAEEVFRRGLDPLSIEGVRAYFQLLYWVRGADEMDAATLGRERWPILERIAAGSRECALDFGTIAQVFRMIDEAQETVIVPYDDGSRALLRRLGRPRARAGAIYASCSNMPSPFRNGTATLGSLPACCARCTRRSARR